MKTIIRFLGCGLILVVALGLQAQSVPPLINYQGQLLAPNGNPIATGDYDVEISLFPVESGGAAVWGPQVFNGQSGSGLRPKVSVVDGRFNLVLGPEDTQGRGLLEVAAANPSLFLEIKVGTGSPIAPRQQLLTAPYALTAASAGTAAKLNGHDWGAIFGNADPVSGNLGIGVAPSEAKADINGRMRVRQGAYGSSGIWFSQNNGGDRAFVGMLDDNLVGFYTALGAGWAFTVDGSTGTSSALRLNVDSFLQLGTAELHTSNLFGDEYLFVFGVSDTYFGGDVWATTFNTTSDERLKENVETLDNPLQVLEGLRGVTFNFKENPSRKAIDPDQRHVGVLAQEVQKVLPEAVNSDPEGYLAVDYTALIPVLLQAVKEQQKQIEDLREELTSLKSGRF